jgi:hypothetical protein
LPSLRQPLVSSVLSVLDREGVVAVVFELLDEVPNPSGVGVVVPVELAAAGRVPN